MRGVVGGCNDVTMQSLKGEAMPLQQSPCDDFTSTVTPLDPDAPLCPTKTTRLCLQLLVPIGLLRATVVEGKNEWMERRSAKKREGWRDGSGDGWGGGTAGRGPCKRSTVGQRFLLGVQEGGSWSGSMH